MLRTQGLAVSNTSECFDLFFVIRKQSCINEKMLNLSNEPGRLLNMVATWMEPERIVVYEISQEWKTRCVSLFMCGILKNPSA